jgi:hypothetical protein
MNVAMKNMRIQPLEGILMIMEGAQTIDGDEEEELLIIPIKQGRTNELYHGQVHPRWIKKT